MRTESELTRLTIDLPASRHRTIKAMASLNNLSIKDFVIEALDEKLEANGISKKPNKKTAAALRSSLKNPKKLKTFKSSDEAMKWLLTNTTKKPHKKNERNSVR